MKPVLPQMLSQERPDLAFQMLEIGALPTGEQERFHGLLRLFPRSRVTALEVDEAVCEQLNQKASPGLHFYPQALGRTEEERPFYITAAPMCSSLLRPNEAYLALYQNMEVSRLVRTTTVRTCSLDHFARAQ